MQKWLQIFPLFSGLDDNIEDHYVCYNIFLNCVKDKIVLLLMDPKSKQLYSVWDVESRSISWDLMENCEL